MSNTKESETKGKLVPNWTEEEYLSSCGIISNTGWFQIHKAMIIELGMEPSILLQFFMNFHTGVRMSEAYEWQDGWFFCTVEKVEEELGITRRVQFRLLNKLKSARCLEFKKAGMPAKRHIRINPLVVNEIVCEWIKNKKNSDEQSPSQHQTVLTGQHQTVLTTPIYKSKTLLSNIRRGKTPPKTNSKNGRVGFSGTKGIDATPLEKFAIRWAKKIKEVLKNYDPSSRLSNARVETFAKDIRKWSTKCNYSKERIVEVLRWYCNINNYNKQYTPKLRKTGDLFTKFISIEEARSREFKDEPSPWKKDRTSGKVHKQELLDKVWGQYMKQYYDAEDSDIEQSKLDIILKKCGMQPGSIKATVFNP